MFSTKEKGGTCAQLPEGVRPTPVSGIPCETANQVLNLLRLPTPLLVSTLQGATRQKHANLARSFGKDTRHEEVEQADSLSRCLQKAWLRSPEVRGETALPSRKSSTEGRIDAGEIIIDQVVQWPTSLTFSGIYNRDGPPLIIESAFQLPNLLSVRMLVGGGHHQTPLWINPFLCVLLGQQDSTRKLFGLGTVNTTALIGAVPHDTKLYFVQRRIVQERPTQAAPFDRFALSSN